MGDNSKLDLSGIFCGVLLIAGRAHLQNIEDSSSIGLKSLETSFPWIRRFVRQSSSKLSPIISGMFETALIFFLALLNSL